MYWVRRVTRKLGSLLPVLWKSLATPQSRSRAHAQPSIHSWISHTRGKGDTTQGTAQNPESTAEKELHLKITCPYQGRLSFHLCLSLRRTTRKRDLFLKITNPRFTQAPYSLPCLASLQLSSSSQSVYLNQLQPAHLGPAEPVLTVSNSAPDLV